MSTSDDAFLKPIESKKILAVEGMDEINFFDVLLEDMNIRDCDIREVGGKDQFPKKFPLLLKARGFFSANGSPLVTHIGIVRDKDEMKKTEAFESIVNIVRSVRFEPPAAHSQFSNGTPKVGIFIMPGDLIDGEKLEALCLKTVENHAAMPCVNEFAACISALENSPKDIPKAKVQVFKAQVFLTAQPEIVNSVGLGAKKRYWDFNSSALGELKTFLNNLK